MVLLVRRRNTRSGGGPGSIADGQVFAVVGVVYVRRSKRGCYCGLAAARMMEQEVAIDRSLHTLAHRMRCHHTGSPLTHVPVLAVEVAASVVHTVAVALVVLQEISHRWEAHQGDLVSSVAVRVAVVCPAWEASVVDGADAGWDS